MYWHRKPVTCAQFINILYHHFHYFSKLILNVCEGWLHKFSSLFLPCIGERTCNLLVFYPGCKFSFIRHCRQVVYIIPLCLFSITMFVTSISIYAVSIQWLLTLALHRKKTMLENLSFKEKKKKKKFIFFYFSMTCLIHYYVFNILQGYMTSMRLLMKLDG